VKLGTTPKVFRCFDPLPKSRRLIMHLHDIEMPLSHYLLEQVGLTEKQLVKLAKLLQASVVDTVPTKESRFRKAYGRVVGVVIHGFQFSVIGSIPQKTKTPIMWVDVQTPKRSKGKGKR